jgi:hypothetical protein
MGWNVKDVNPESLVGRTPSGSEIRAERLLHALTEAGAGLREAVGSHTNSCTCRVCAAYAVGVKAGWVTPWQPASE